MAPSARAIALLSSDARKQYDRTTERKGLNNSLVAYALAAMTAFSPVSHLLAGQTSVMLDQGDTATVQGGTTKVTVDSSGNVRVHINGNSELVVTRNDSAANATASALMEIGQYIAGKGIYMGQWKPEGLSRTFNLFADRRDFGVATFDETVKRLARLKGHDGHDGFNHHAAGDNPEQALYDALRTDSYNGEWFIPPLDVLKENLFKNRFSVAAADAFLTEYAFSHAHWYWSCTEHPDDSALVYNVDFSDGDGDWDHKDGYKPSTRPVRAEPAAP
ncbi:MAG: hypothetical protein AB7S78_14310 [Candidatus Omnitrophota bacterium]